MISAKNMVINFILTKPLDIRESLRDEVKKQFNEKLAEVQNVVPAVEA